MVDFCLGSCRLCFLTQIQKCFTTSCLERVRLPQTAASSLLSLFGRLLISRFTLLVAPSPSVVEVGAFLLLDFFGLAFPPRSPIFCGDIITTLKPPPSVLPWPWPCRRHCWHQRLRRWRPGHPWRAGPWR